MSKVIELNVDQAVEMALKNNVTIKNSELDTQIAESEIEPGLADFDFNLTAAVGYTLDRNLSNANYHLPTAGVILTKTFNTSIGAKKKFSTGTEAEFTLQTLHYVDQSAIATLPKRYQGAFLFGLSQPLLKNRGFEINLMKYNKAQKKHHRYEAQLKEDIEDRKLKVKQYFWEFYRAYQELETQTLAALESKQIFDEDTIRLKVGKLSKVDFMHSRAQKAIDAADLAQAEYQYQTQEEKLIREIFPLEESWKEIEIRPMVKEQNSTTLQIVGESEFEVRANHNNQVKRMLLESQEKELEYRQAKLENQWTLNLNFEVSSLGLQTGLSNTLSDTVSFKSISWQVLVELSMPLLNYGNHGNEKRTLATYQQTKIQADKQAKQIVLLSYQSSHNAQRLAQVLKNRIKELNLNQQRVKAKKELYRLGKISSREYFEAIRERVDLERQQSQDYAQLQIELAQLEELLPPS